MKRLRSENDKQTESNRKGSQHGLPSRIPSTLSKPVSPPRRRSRIRSTENSEPTRTKSQENPVSETNGTNNNEQPQAETPSLSAIESGQATVTNHLAVISTKLSQCMRPTGSNEPRISLTDWTRLYKHNEHENGAHFVIHQHDHPIAGTHYDLRLQFSGTSSVSWSVVFGMPGDPNSERLNRNAIETRVHCLWNHLIETASENTGSMLIWDTGVYEVLPYITKNEPETEAETDSSSSINDVSHSSGQRMTESEKLREAFRNGKIRLRLHGTRLPPNYTVALRLDKNSDFVRDPVRGPQKKRRRRTQTRRPSPISTSSSSPSPPERDHESTRSQSPIERAEEEDDDNQRRAPKSDNKGLMANIDNEIRANNAYPGATNIIGSIHQRRWFLSLDRLNSGFICEISKDDSERTKKKRKWVRRREQNNQGERLSGFEPFYVRGPDFEKSIVTGRLAGDILSDEGVEGFVRRRGWRAVI